MSGLTSIMIFFTKIRLRLDEVPLKTTLLIIFIPVIICIILVVLEAQFGFFSDFFFSHEYGHLVKRYTSAITFDKKRFTRLVVSMGKLSYATKTGRGITVAIGVLL